MDLEVFKNFLDVIKNDIIELTFLDCTFTKLMGEGMSS